MGTSKTPNLCVTQIFHNTHLQRVKSSYDPALAGESLDLVAFRDAKK